MYVVAHSPIYVALKNTNEAISFGSDCTFCFTDISNTERAVFV